MVLSINLNAHNVNGMTQFYLPYKVEIRQLYLANNFLEILSLLYLGTNFHSACWIFGNADINHIDLYFLQKQYKRQLKNASRIHSPSDVSQTHKMDKDQEEANLK